MRSKLKEEKNMMIRRLYGQEVLDALHLVWDVFVQDVAPCYTSEGVEAFSQFIRYENIEQKMRRIDCIWRL